MKAILNENADRATTLAEKLSKSQEDLARFKLEAYNFKPENPFDAWLVAIDAMRKGLASIGAPVASLPTTPGLQTGIGSLGITPNIPQSIVPEMATTPTFAMGGVQRGEYAPTITVNVTGSGGLDEQTKRAVVDAVVEASSGGIATNWFRTTGRAVATL